MPRYYDIDAILAEEELVPCTTLFDFSYLSHLDPDASVVDTQQQHQLPENTRIKLPLWAVQRWSIMGFVRLSLPRHFTRKTRERIEAEPADVNLR
jgi:GINS complex subunit 3